MIGFKKIKVIIKEYGVVNGLAHILNKVIVKLLCYIRAMLLGWSGAQVPAFSRIINPSRMKVGRGFYAASPVWIEAVSEYKNQTYTPLIKIGNGFSCSNGLHISCVKNIVIGDNCLCGSNVYIGDHNHGSYSGLSQSNPIEPPSARVLHSDGEIRIGNNVWIGNNVVILAPTEIKDGCIVAANSVVKGEFAKNLIIAGSPATIIKEFDEESEAWIRKKISR